MLKLYLFLPIILISNISIAGVYKCTDPKTGNIIFSDSVCATSSNSQKVYIPPTNTTPSYKPKESNQLGSNRVMSNSKVMPNLNTQTQNKTGMSDYEDEIYRKNEARTLRSHIGNRKPTVAEQKLLYFYDTGKPFPGGYDNERESSSSSRTSNLPMPSQAPSVITNCDNTGCWDNLGTRYNKGAGNTYFRSTGGVCQGIGGQMQCN